MTQKESLQRTCTSCGLLKPLSAFLYLTDKGTTYGTLCATCRGIQARNPKNEDEDVSRRTTGSRIGSQEKVQIEKTTQQRIEKKTEEHIKEAKKREFKLTTQEERNTQTKLEEKKHLTEYIFLSANRNKKPPPSTQEKPAQTSSDPAQTREQVRQQKYETEEKSKKENKLTEGASFFIDAAQTGMVSRQSEVIRRFFTLVGTSSPAARKQVLDQLLQKNPAPSKDEAINTEEVIKEIDKHLGPKSR